MGKEERGAGLVGSTDEPLPLPHLRWECIRFLGLP